MALFQGVQEAVRNDVVAVGLTTVKIAESRNDITPRITILVRNTSPNATDVITINLGLGTPTANYGIVLKQYESFTDSSDQGYQCFQGSYTAVCATATGQLSIMER